MPNRFVVILVAALTVSSEGALAAGAPTAGNGGAGKAKAAVCSACHGPTGVSASGAWPNLAGQKQTYLVKQLKAFRDGGRKNPLMSPMAKPLSDADIEALAAYFAAQSVGPAPRPVAASVPAAARRPPTR